MAELKNPKTGKTREFPERQARWYRNHGWEDVKAKPPPKPPKPPEPEPPTDL